MAEEEIKAQDNGDSTPDELSQLKAELEQEKAEREKLIAEATQPLLEQVATLGEALKQKDEELAKQTSSAQALQEKLGAAVAEFRTLVLQTNPLYTEDLIAGATIEELKQATDRANAIIAKVREGVQSASQAEAAATKVPAGAPGRKEPDISSMTIAEKINYGLEQARRKTKG